MSTGKKGEGPNIGYHSKETPDGPLWAIFVGAGDASGVPSWHASTEFLSSQMMRRALEIAAQAQQQGGVWGWQALTILLGPLAAQLWQVPLAIRPQICAALHYQGVFCRP